MRVGNVEQAGDAAHKMRLIIVQNPVGIGDMPKMFDDLEPAGIVEQILHRAGEGVDVRGLLPLGDSAVDQIERFYAKYLPLSKEMALNLQAFGDEG